LIPPAPPYSWRRGYRPSRSRPRSRSSSRSRWLSRGVDGVTLRIAACGDPLGDGDQLGLSRAVRPDSEPVPAPVRLRGSDHASPMPPRNLVAMLPGLCISWSAGAIVGAGSSRWDAKAASWPRSSPVVRAVAGSPHVFPSLRPRARVPVRLGLGDCCRVHLIEPCRVGGVTVEVRRCGFRRARRCVGKIPRRVPGPRHRSECRRFGLARRRGPRLRRARLRSAGLSAPCARPDGPPLPSWSGGWSGRLRASRSNMSAGESGRFCKSLTRKQAGTRPSWHLSGSASVRPIPGSRLPG
jgi:hypothetical protein